MIRDFSLIEVLSIVAGVKATVLLSLIAFVGGGVGGLLVALLRTSAGFGMRTAAASFIDFFQGTPMLMQLFLVYYGLPVFGFHVNVWVAASVGLTLHASAFLGDIWRGGIEAVPRGQTEAASALGLSYFHRMIDVVLPQAFRLSLAPTVGFLVQLVKGTSLTAIIGFVELSRSAQIAASTTYRPLLAYGAAGICYFVICFPLSRYASALEKRLAARV
jgi:polar amino acid transport system permease protein